MALADPLRTDANGSFRATKIWPLRQFKFVTNEYCCSDFDKAWVEGTDITIELRNALASAMSTPGNSSLKGERIDILDMQNSPQLHSARCTIVLCFLEGGGHGHSARLCPYLFQLSGFKSDALYFIRTCGHKPLCQFVHAIKLIQEKALSDSGLITGELLNSIHHFNCTCKGDP